VNTAGWLVHKFVPTLISKHLNNTTLFNSLPSTSPREGLSANTPNTVGQSVKLAALGVRVEEIRRVAARTWRVRAAVGGSVDGTRNGTQPVVAAGCLKKQTSGLFFMYEVSHRDFLMFGC
jgi:hypothetical protein